MKTIIVLGVVALIAIFLISQYNRLIRLNITVDEAWAQIEVQLKRRADLIPNLVETVKGICKARAINI
jgi:LemA protein